MTGRDHSLVGKLIHIAKGPYRFGLFLPKCWLGAQHGLHGMIGCTGLIWP